MINLCEIFKAHHFILFYFYIDQILIVSANKLYKYEIKQLSG